ncbi:hypothetical protein BV25DRAFT_1819823 [Artomyces pyxidatus]|uniref:Uncharacterized protein n=1 Tax=Artomyces pyxidatus TaxID=48021 RepID=A0ACB8TGF6_9AGAM|nr:hypothetical protein BV25DRAFT_1819823 [Artomyces pyxidatus]
MHSQFKNGQAGPSSSGLTLVLPSLKALQELKAKKQKGSPLSQESAVKKIPRPVKLKPLKEVLTSLITKIKKKDDYAFFLEPVDPVKVAGYADLIKRPMDLGTMTTKVAKGKYRSLEEFAADFHLVISNAKTFNIPGTIYYSEAERIEAWASEHISKAASQVIEYETDWNIEIERDEELNVDADEDAAASGTPTGLETPARRSPSVGSSSVPPPNRRGRGAGKKPDGLTETLEPDGHLPGFKDGVGVFPPGSDWAEVMLALKLKGKRYRTKKERMRMEKGGPPYAADGSIDYTEMEDPFSVLSVLVPEPASRPLVTPLFPPPPPDPSQTTLPPPATIPTPGEPPPSSSLAPSSASTSLKNGPSKYRHWVVNRSFSTRSKVKDKEEETHEPAWKTPRELHATDYGSFATLVGRLAAETHTQRTDVSAAFGTQEKLLEAIRSTVEGKAVAAFNQSKQEEEQGAAKVAQDWLREVVYGGVDGLAYLRSIAEFVSPQEGQSRPSVDSPLGMPLDQFINTTLVDHITDGRHRIVDGVARHVSIPGVPLPTLPAIDGPPAPPPVKAKSELLRQLDGPLDLAALIRVPDELFAAESAWAVAARNSGAGVDDPIVLARALDHAADLLQQLDQKKKEQMQKGGDGEVGGAEVDPLETELRLNLIALAKRAPLDQIARMPANLVPAHLRYVVPTIGF